MRLRCRLTCFTLLLAMAGPVHLTATGFENETGEVKLLGQSASSTRRLAALQKHAASGELPEAVAEYIRLLENAGNDMAPLDNKHCIQLRWLAHRTLLNLPLSAVQLYRERTDEKINDGRKRPKALAMSCCCAASSMRRSAAATLVAPWTCWAISHSSAAISTKQKTGGKGLLP